MTVQPWFASSLDPSLTPSTTVYTMRLLTFCGDNTDPVLCDVAWTTETERSDHFWYADRDMGGEQKEPLTMTLAEYIDRHVRECPAMNPFYEIGRAQFLVKWRAMT